MAETKTNERISRMQTSDEQVGSLRVDQELVIAAPIEITFESVLEEIGPGSVLQDGTPFPMKIEAWPGGRLFRDLGNNAGHFWGHVQVIKPPTLLEICGPLFMSYPAISHLQYRLKAEGSGTRLTLIHRAIGQIPAEHKEGVNKGWDHALKRIKELAEKRKGR
jgi:Activator of Hsp90 ATPase homolog 1-like protein